MTDKKLALIIINKTTESDMRQKSRLSLEECHFKTVSKNASLLLSFIASAEQYYDRVSCIYADMLYLLCGRELSSDSADMLMLSFCSEPSDSLSFAVNGPTGLP